MRPVVRPKMGYWLCPNAMHTALIDLLLEYEVSSPAHFLFNSEAAFYDANHPRNGSWMRLSVP